MIKDVCFNNPGSLSGAIEASKSGGHFQHAISLEHKTVVAAGRGSSQKHPDLETFLSKQLSAASKTRKSSICADERFGISVANGNAQKSGQRSRVSD
jgi:hypothetical protein